MLWLTLLILRILICCADERTDSFMAFPGDRGIIFNDYSDYFDDEMTIYDPYTEEMLDDMIITRSEFKRLFYPNVQQLRNAVNDKDSLWPNKTLLYFIDREFYENEREIIREGIKMITENSCLKFVELQRPPSDKKAYVHINSISGCFSKVGSKCSKCTMSLSVNGCLKAGTVAHEFLHSLGFYHMQCSKGRDDYVEIKWENMKDNVRKNFLELADLSNLLNTTYDYDSILHYGARFFSANGEPTIIPKDLAYLDKIGQRERLSEGDIKRLNLLYEC